MEVSNRHLCIVPYLTKVFGAVDVGAAQCSEAMPSWMLKSLQSSPKTELGHPVPLLAMRDSVLPSLLSVCLLSLCCWDGNGMMDYKLSPIFMTLCQSRRLLLILQNTISALGKLAETRCEPETAATLQSFCRNKLGVKFLLRTELHPIRWAK